MNDIRSEFKKLVIEAIHNLSYSEAVEMESGLCYEDNVFKMAHWSKTESLGKWEELNYIHPITIGCYTGIEK